MGIGAVLTNVADIAECSLEQQSNILSIGVRDKMNRQLAGWLKR